MLHKKFPLVLECPSRITSCTQNLLSLLMKLYPSKKRGGLLITVTSILFTCKKQSTSVRGMCLASMGYEFCKILSAYLKIAQLPFP